MALSGTYRAVAIQDDWTSPMATVTFAGGSLFTDFTSDDWYFDYVDDAVSLGLFSGRGNEFDPTQTITRAEFAAAWPTWPGWTPPPTPGTAISATSTASGTPAL